MKILHLCSHLEAGGITTYVTTVARALAAKGHQVTVASGGGAWERRLTGGIRHRRLPLNTSAEFSPQVWWAGWQLSRDLRRQPPDVIHAHTRVAQVVAHGLWVRRRIPYVTTWHGFYRRRWGRRWWPCTGAVTLAISEPVAAHLRDVFSVPAERIRLVPHGIDVAAFSEPVSPEDQARLREQWKLPSRDPVIGTVVRLVPDKGVDQLLHGFRYVTTKFSDANLLIAGDGPARPALQRLADRLGIARRVRFVGSVPETRAALAVMDLFVFLPATREGFGLSLLEAMASGRPIVSVQRGGGATWALEQSGAGLTVPAEEPLRLGQVLVELLDDRARMRELGAQAQGVAASRYDVPRMIAEIERAYQDAVSTARRVLRHG